MQRSKYREEVHKLLASLDGQQENGKPELETQIPDTQEPIEDVYVLIFREREADQDEQVIDSTAEDLDTTPLPTPPAPQPSSNTATGILPFGVFIILSCIMSIMFQFYLIINPFTVNVTLAAKGQQVSLYGTLPLGRVLNPITVSQTTTVPTTGHGHQDAKQATGTVTFYDGLFIQQFVAQGTVFTGSDGVQIVTTQSATIPPGNPATGYGEVTVTAQAEQSRTSGNIHPGDINITINNGLLVRNNQFSGGQDERSYQVVTKTDITNAAAPLKVTLAQSVQGALQGQLKTNEALVTPSCATTTTASNQPGQEATQVKVTISETCSAVAYNQDTLQAKVTQLLTAQAAKKLETGYSLLGNPQITITGATTSKQVTLSFSSVSTWVYALSGAEQKNIKKIIAGKTKEKATALLLSLPGIERVSLQSSGFGDDTRIPKDIKNIHLAIFYGL